MSNASKRKVSTEPEVCLPVGWSMDEAIKTKRKGASGRMQLENLSGKLMCGTADCLFVDRHAGPCMQVLAGEPRARKQAKRPLIDDTDDGTQPAAGKKSKPALPKPAASAPPTKTKHRKSRDASLEQDAGSQHVRLPSQLLLCDPSASNEARLSNGTPGHALLAAAVNTMDLIPNMRTAPTFLDTNAQAHPNAFSPIADLVDNCVEARASRLDINLDNQHGLSILKIVDDGIGMSERTLLDGPLSIAYTGKAGTHYGMGATTSIPAIAAHALIFSCDGGTRRTVGCLSSELSVIIKAEQTKVLQASWELTPSGFQLIRTTDDDYPHDLAAREASLELITAFGPCRSEEALMEVFESMPSSGTALVLWGDGLDLKYRRDGHKKDIINKQVPSDSWGHDRSLREFLSLLYYVDDHTDPPLNISLMGRLVKPRNWSSYLYQSSDARYKPHGENVAVSMRFGHSVPLPQLRENFSSRAQDKDKKLQEYRGVFYYNRDQDKTRMILPLEPSKVQQPLANGITTMAITQRRICEWGFGVVGVVIEEHLQPAHNKRGYLSQESNAHFHKLKSAVDEKMRSYLKGHVTPAYKRLLEPGSSREVALFDANQATEKKKKKKDKSGQECAIVEGMRVRTPSGEIGRAAREGRTGYFKLELPNGWIDDCKAYKAEELTPTKFDPAVDMPTGFIAVDATLLDATRVKVLWNDAELDDSSWEEGELSAATRPGQRQQRQRGWFFVSYEDAFMDEWLFVAAAADNLPLTADSQLLIYREDGEELKIGRDIQILIPEGRRDEDTAEVEVEGEEETREEREMFVAVAASDDDDDDFETVHSTVALQGRGACVRQASVEGSESNAAPSSAAVRRSGDAVAHCQVDCGASSTGAQMVAPVYGGVSPDVAALEENLQGLRAELNTAQAELALTKKELTEARKKQAELNNAQAELNLTKKELTEAREKQVELDSVQAELALIKQKLAEALEKGALLRQELDGTKSDLARSKEKERQAVRGEVSALKRLQDFLEK